MPAPALARLAFDALDHDLYEAVIARLEREPDQVCDSHPELWQALGLALRGLQDSEAAYMAFVRAAAQRPNDALLAHSKARTALEAGFPAVALFEQAHRLAPAHAPVLLGRAAARLAQGQAEQACAELAAVLEANPGWIEGHVTWAKVAASGKLTEDPWTTLHEALARFPRDPSLWRALIRVAIDAGDHARALDFVRQAQAVLDASPELSRIEAFCLGEQGDPLAAIQLLDGLPAATSVTELVTELRNLIRLERFDEALAKATRRFSEVDERALWPYRALLWRMTADPRWQWLEGDPAMISVHDLAGEIGDMPALVNRMRALHGGTGQPLDQSVRGGSQTDGNLLARAEPEIRQLRAVLLDAVRDHVANLPAPKAGHPTLLDCRNPVRVAGAWSIRLADRGYHVDHVHLSGWISSCLYLALPEGAGGIGRGGSREGWLTLGANRALLPELEPFREVEPVVGRLVLFPSLTWHGTRPFAKGERMTVAFDIAQPRP